LFATELIQRTRKARARAAQLEDNVIELAGVSIDIVDCFVKFGSAPTQDVKRGAQDPIAGNIFGLGLPQFDELHAAGRGEANRRDQHPNDPAGRNPKSSKPHDNSRGRAAIEKCAEVCEVDAGDYNRADSADRCDQPLRRLTEPVGRRP
jgi:hypothetical protein